MKMYKNCVECGLEKTDRRQQRHPRCKPCSNLLNAILRGPLKQKFFYCLKCGIKKPFNYYQRCLKCALSNQRHSDEHKRKISESMMNHPVSDEARKKMSEKKKEYWAKKREPK